MYAPINPAIKQLKTTATPCIPGIFWHKSTSKDYNYASDIKYYCVPLTNLKKGMKMLGSNLTVKRIE